MTDSDTKILILGCSGMLGSSLLRDFSQRQNIDLKGTVRSLDGLDKHFSRDLLDKLTTEVDANNLESVRNCIVETNPDVVINCIGIIKQLPSAQNSIQTIAINALFPHQVAGFCKESDARLIHISTDCVFTGEKGNYTEQDNSDAQDLYGRTKFLGEVTEQSHCITLRTSIIGHELSTELSLVDWFLSQTGTVKGFTGAIYTGFPTVEMARIIAEFVIPNENLKGLYQVSAEPINKFELLKLMAKTYEKEIEIVPFDEFKCDRSLDSSKFMELAKYNPPSWENMVESMHKDYITNY